MRIPNITNYKPKEFATLLNVTVKTLQRWDREKILVANRTPTNRRYYTYDMGLKEPYSSQVPLGTSEVAEDLTYYFATSEQVPSAVGLGVLMSKDNTVKQAGGFIVQLMPFADEETIQALEDRISKITSVTDMLEKGMTPEDILKEVMGDMDVEFTDKIDTQFKCTCSKEKIVKALAGLSNKELDEIINDGKAIEVKCDFCNTTYKFSVEELKTLRKKY